MADIRSFASNPQRNSLLWHDPCFVPGMMQVAILDVSPLTAWTVCRLLPPGIEVRLLSALEDAEGLLRDCPPDAFLIGLTAGAVPWEELLESCRLRNVPYFLYYSLHALPPEATLSRAVESAAVSPVELGGFRETLHAFLKQRAKASE